MRRMPAAVTLGLLLLLGPTMTIRAADRDAATWDGIYEQTGYRYGLHALPVLDEWAGLLASRAPGGRALDIASGEGQNAVRLAQYGYSVDCVDISRVGLAKASTLARVYRVADRLNAIRADLELYRIEPGAYDCVINMRFLMRPLAPQISRGLKPGGILIFETFTKDDPKAGEPGANPAYFLDRNELLRLFPDLLVLRYAERFVDGRAVATLVAVKPGPGVGLDHANPSEGAGTTPSSPCCPAYKVRGEEPRRR